MKKVEDIDSRRFISFLKENDFRGIKKIPKSDLHNHAIYGGCREYLCDLIGIYIPVLNHKISSVESIDDYITQYTRNISLPNGEYFIMLMAASLFQAKVDGIKVLLLDIDAWMLYTYFNSDLESLSRRLHEIVINSNDVRIIFQIGISRYAIKENIEKWFENLWNCDLIASIDLYGPEEYDNTLDVMNVYRKAKERGWKLCAHLGEWGDSDTLINVAEKLQLDHINHGICVSNSEKAMEYIRKHEITLHICPTSNIMLKRCNNYSEHPIGALYRNGVKVTINSDDLLVFGSDVSLEYLRLYNAGTLTAEELDEIRVYGLNLFDRDGG